MQVVAAEVLLLLTRVSAYPHVLCGFCSICRVVVRQRMPHPTIPSVSEKGSLRNGQKCDIVDNVAARDLYVGTEWGYGACFVLIRQHMWGSRKAAHAPMHHPIGF